MTAPSTRIRLRFAKQGDLRFVSHHDLMRCFERALRRANLPVALSQGFNPRPRMVFAQAMALGIEGLREVVDLELTEPLPPDEVLRRLGEASPPGLTFLEAHALTVLRTAQPLSAEYRLPLPPHRVQSASTAVAELLSAPSRPYLRRRTDHTRQIDLRPFVIHAEVDAHGVLLLLMKLDPAGSARPEEVLETLGLRDLLAEGSVLVRSDLALAP